jgi:hypothetical protein
VLISHFFNHVRDTAARRWRDNGSARLTFSPGNASLPSSLMAMAFSRESSSMTFIGPLVGPLSLVAAYAAIAFVGAIVLGLF